MLWPFTHGSPLRAPRSYRLALCTLYFALCSLTPSSTLHALTAYPLAFLFPCSPLILYTHSTACYKYLEWLKTQKKRHLTPRSIRWRSSPKFLSFHASRYEPLSERARFQSFALGNSTVSLRPLLTAILLKLLPLRSVDSACGKRTVSEALPTSTSCENKKESMEQGARSVEPPLVITPLTSAPCSLLSCSKLPVLHRVYFAAITRKELLAKPRLSSTERRRVELLLLKHRLIPVDENIAENFSFLLQKYSRQGLRNADALVAATAWSRNLPLFTRNIRHYRFISEITLFDPLKEWKRD